MCLHVNIVPDLEEMFCGKVAWIRFVCRRAFKCCVIGVWCILVVCILSKHYRTDNTVPQMYSIETLTKDQDSPNTHRTYVSLVNGNVHIYSAVARNSTTNPTRVEKIAMSGWEQALFRNLKYKCCVLFGNDDIEMKPALDKLHWSYLGKAHLEAKQIICQNPRAENDSIPLGVSLANENQCPKDTSLYIKVDVPQKQPAKQIAVCTKVAYDKLDASSIIEWFEMQIALGVNKVLTYTNNLNDAAMSVLDYYNHVGIGEHYPFYLPDTERFSRIMGVKNFQGWNDEQVSVFDCQTRLAGFDYMALFDMDEYVIPRKTDNFSNLMQSLRAAAPGACGFTFKTELYATTWGQTEEGTNSNLAIGKYFYRTRASTDRVKSIMINNRIEPGRISTHGYWALKSANKIYTKSMVDIKQATLKHYRTCRKEWMRHSGNKCYNEVSRVKDRSMEKWAERIEDRVNHVKGVLGIE